MAGNKIIVGGSLIPSTSDSPLDGRTRVGTFEEIESILNPYLGMKVFVEDTGKEYVVRRLKDKQVGNVIVTGGAVDMDGVFDTAEELSQKVRGDILKSERYEYNNEECSLTIL